MLRSDQIERILNQISKNILLYIGVNLGEGVLSEVDRTLLASLGIKASGLGGTFPAYFKMYLLGRLTQLLGDYNSQRVGYDDFETYLLKHQYQPLTPFEEAQYRLAQQRTYSHLKNLEGRIRTDVNGMITGVLTRAEYEDIIKREIARGVKERRSINAIVSEIGHATGDWQKDLHRIVETEMNDIYQQGRAAQITRDSKERDPSVYKDVYPGACRHCIRLYLTGGLGSAPRVFRLSELIANGTNIGRRVDDWLPVVGSTHPWCRCHLRYLPPDMEWDKDKQQFVYSKQALQREEQRLGIRGKVKVTVGDKVFEV